MTKTLDYKDISFTIAETQESSSTQLIVIELSLKNQANTIYYWKENKTHYSGGWEPIGQNLYFELLNDQNLKMRGARYDSDQAFFIYLHELKRLAKPLLHMNDQEKEKVNELTD